ncbi:MAG: outer rane efflux protein [Fluviicola sp.]|jgi:outer membrane protein TolC|uniref:TolC family protein n=1 Tax=Fluviicola sp. TaxID=1917219 RepID=UPI00260AB917|nr:TolC family protein [Fluviicola sp.]MDF3029070.1 outer rane efflux protein [Fluviicola sp.]
MKQKITLLIAISASLFMHAYSWSQGALEKYIQQGLDSNLVLKQRSIQLEKALLTLNTAKSNFLPSVNFNASYTTAEGGRYADLPIGDMLNPVYTTLNQMTGTNAFPQIQNQQINFLPTNFYDTYIRTSVPLLNTDIYANKRIQEQKVELSNLDMQVYARELVKNIKVAYYNVIMASKSVSVYETNKKVLEQNVALNEALIKQGKGLKVNLLKAQTELMKMNTSISTAKNQLTNARAYFNFLINRSLDSEIILEEVSGSNPQLEMKQEREEIQLINQSIGVQESVLKMNKNYWVPKVNAFLDLGSQGTNWEVSRKSAYYMFGISASIPIYNGSRNQQQIKQTKYELESAKIQLDQISQQLELQRTQSLRNVVNAKENWETAQVQLEASKEYFALVSGANREGLTNQLEFIDASNQVTNAELFVLIQYQNYLSSLAELERAAATYPLKFNQ